MQANASVDTSIRGILGGPLVDKVYEGYLLVFLADTLGISEIFGKLPLSSSVSFYLHIGVCLNRMQARADQWGSEDVVGGRRSEREGHSCEGRTSWKGGSHGRVESHGKRVYSFQAPRLHLDHQPRIFVFNA